VLQGSALRLAKVVEETSGGRFQIEVFASGQIVQPVDCFERAPVAMSPARRPRRSSARIQRRAMVSGAPRHPAAAV